MKHSHVNECPRYRGPEASGQVQVVMLHLAKRIHLFRCNYSTPHFLSQASMTASLVDPSCRASVHLGNGKATAFTKLLASSAPTDRAQRRIHGTMPDTDPKITFAPRAASWAAASRPRPLVAPVMSATRPVRSPAPGPGPDALVTCAEGSSAPRGRARGDAKAPSGLRKSPGKLPSLSSEEAAGLSLPIVCCCCVTCHSFGLSLRLIAELSQGLCRAWEHGGDIGGVQHWTAM